MNTAPYIDCVEFILRLPKESDIKDRQKLGRSAEFVKMCGGSTIDFNASFSEEALKNWYNKICNHPCEWVIELNEKCVGAARLTISTEENEATYAIGIFDESLYGKGLGTKVTIEVLKYAFITLGLQKVKLVVLEYNKRGIACYEKCGFQQESIIENNLLLDGQYYSDVVMSIYSSDFVEFIK